MQKMHAVSGLNFRRTPVRGCGSLPISNLGILLSEKRVENGLARGTLSSVPELKNGVLMVTALRGNQGSEKCVSARLGGKPLLSSLVAGNLAQRLWGVGKYRQLGRRGNGAWGDFGTVALLESRKRGSERISWEDRRAAMQVWQEEDRKLKSRFMLDPTLELQIKTVAKALSLRGTLDGDELRRVMDEALEICSNPDVPVAASAASHGG
jgi:hypothetical protein